VQIARRIKVQLMAPQCKIPHTHKKKKEKKKIMINLKIEGLEGIIDLCFPF
jgi:hypothetical protein